VPFQGQTYFHFLVVILNFRVPHRDQSPGNYDAMNLWEGGCGGDVDAEGFRPSAPVPAPQRTPSLPILNFRRKVRLTEGPRYYERFQSEA
jgi:hypothetical protein